MGLKVSEVCVGDDAYIVQAECTAYTEFSGKFVRALGSMWASTPTNLPEGVEHPGKLHKNHRLGCFGSRAGFLVPVGEIVQKAADGKRRGRVFAQRKTERPAGRNAERADGDFVGNPAQDQSREDTEPEPAFDHRHDRVIVHRAKLHVRLELVAL